ncbi:MAG: hypothetical protein A49_14090 [Methyloceanibacter sp.]|nr:MAG: hypothetical protein A49_14090 [Methyloceanibacter sp.]
MGPIESAQIEHAKTVRRRLFHASRPAPGPRSTTKVSWVEAPRNDRRKPVTIRDIVKAVCTHFGVSRTYLLSARRHRSIVRPRQIAIYLSAQMLSCSSGSIGRQFGNRDHTTVLHSVRVVSRLIESDPQIAQDVAEIKRGLGA